MKPQVMWAVVNPKGIVIDTAEYTEKGKNNLFQNWQSSLLVTDYRIVKVQVTEIVEHKSSFEEYEP